MRTISDAVKTIIESDAIVLEASRLHVLNASAYAKQIQSRVAEVCAKPVKLGSIIAAILRYGNRAKLGTELLPNIKVDVVSVQSGLAEVTYTKGARVPNLIIPDDAAHPFMTITHGPHEITVITTHTLAKFITDQNFQKPIVCIDGLSAVSVQFSPSYLDTPNAIYSMVSELAYRRINIIEIVSTFSELVFIVRDAEVALAVKSLQGLLLVK